MKYINDELDNGCLYLADPKGECMEKDTPPDAYTSESVAKVLQLLYHEHVPLLLGAIREC